MTLPLEGSLSDGESQNHPSDWHFIDKGNYTLICGTTSLWSSRCHAGNVNGNCPKMGVTMFFFRNEHTRANNLDLRQRARVLTFLDGLYVDNPDLSSKTCGNCEAGGVISALHQGLMAWVNSVRMVWLFRHISRGNRHLRGVNTTGFESTWLATRSGGLHEKAWTTTCELLANKERIFDQEHGKTHPQKAMKLGEFHFIPAWDGHRLDEDGDETPHGFQGLDFVG